jgi:hypothetical protein
MQPLGSSVGRVRNIARFIHNSPRGNSFPRPGPRILHSPHAHVPKSLAKVPAKGKLISRYASLFLWLPLASRERPQGVRRSHQATLRALRRRIGRLKVVVATPIMRRCGQDCGTGNRATPPLHDRALYRIRDRPHMTASTPAATHMDADARWAE